jgi:nicotinamidase/pyrazinamidase
MSGTVGRAALILIDVQNDFADPRGALAVAGAADILPEIGKLLAAARRRGDLVVATQDWHPADHVSFAATHGLPPFATMATGQRVWPAHCVAGDWGADLAPGLDPVAIDRRVRKGFERDRDSYSGFGGREFTGDAPGPALEEILRAAGVTALDVAGVATDYCVRATVLDALRLGFSVRVHRAAVRAVDPAAGESALAGMAAAGATLV